MSVARNILKNPKLVPGGGASELTVSATLKQKSSSIEGIEKVKLFHPNVLYICKIGPKLWKWKSELFRVKFKK
jgi:hypothetical protein